MITNVIKRAKIGKQCLVTGLCVAVMAGCRISVPQAESSYRFVKDLISSDDNSPQGQQAIWLASVDEYGAILRPYLSGGFIVFANTDGDAIAFDGWTIRSIVGFGFAGPLLHLR